MFKDEVVAMDQGLFDKNGSRLSPGNSIYDDFNSVTINKLKSARSRSVTVTFTSHWINQTFVVLQFVLAKDIVVVIFCVKFNGDLIMNSVGVTS